MPTTKSGHSDRVARQQGECGTLIITTTQAGGRLRFIRRPTNLFCRAIHRLVRELPWVTT